MKSNLIFCVLLFLSTTLLSQSSSIGIFLGGSLYKGDVSASDLSVEELNFAAGAKFKQQISNKFSANMNLLFGSITGDDRNYADRADWNKIDFQSNLTEISATLEWHPFDKRNAGIAFVEDGLYDNEKNEVKQVDDYFVTKLTNGQIKVYDSRGNYKIFDEEGNLLDQKFNGQFSPYLFFGVGLTTINADINGLPSNAPEITRGKNKGTYFALPVGLGLLFDTNAEFSVSLELGARLPTTDYLDGLSESRSDNHNDAYVFGGVTVYYKLGKSIMRNAALTAFKKY
ncbi:MAG: DUF6089 family protein [Bacteroidota bacterium]